MHPDAGWPVSGPALHSSPSGSRGGAGGRAVPAGTCRGAFLCRGQPTSTNDFPSATARLQGATPAMARTANFADSRLLRAATNRSIRSGDVEAPTSANTLQHSPPAALRQSPGQLHCAIVPEQLRCAIIWNGARACCPDYCFAATFRMIAKVRAGGVADQGWEESGLLRGAIVGKRDEERWRGSGSSRPDVSTAQASISARSECGRAMADRLVRMRAAHTRQP